MRKLSLFVVLMVFWFLLSGETSAFLLGAGVICCALTTFICARMGLVDREGHPVDLTFRFLRYIPWLLWQVAIANVDVARRIWSPKLSIDPCMVEVPVNMKTTVATVTYANSITLTPGTVTVRVADDRFLIHALTQEAAADLETGEMHRRVQRFEGSAS